MDTSAVQDPIVFAGLREVAIVSLALVSRMFFFFHTVLLSFIGAAENTVLFETDNWKSLFLFCR